MIYFDHNATTAIDQRVLEAMLPFLHTFYGNASSLYRLGRLARSAIETAREQVASLVSVSPNQVIFTSGGTEANALGLHFPQCSQWIVSAIEHPSVMETVFQHQHQASIKTIPVNSEGIVEVAQMNELSLNSSTMVSIMLANNETGCIQPVADYAQNCRAFGAIVHTDAVQAVGKISVNFNQLGVHRLSLSSHKIYGPKGCGALIFDPNFPPHAHLPGGGQEFGYRSGTENVAAIVGLGKAAELAQSELFDRQQHLLTLRLYLEQQLQQIPRLHIFAANSERLPNTVQFGVSGINGEMLLMLFDQRQIAVSSGSACAASHNQPSPVLIAMGIATELANSAIRISLGQHNTRIEIDQFIHILKQLLIINRNF